MSHTSCHWKHILTYESQLLWKTYELISRTCLHRRHEHMSHLLSPKTCELISRTCLRQMNSTCLHWTHMFTWVTLVLTEDISYESHLSWLQTYDHMKRLASTWIQTAWPGFSSAFNEDQHMHTSSNSSLSCCLTRGDESLRMLALHELIQVDSLTSWNKSTWHFCLLCLVASSHATSEETTWEKIEQAPALSRSLRKEWVKFIASECGARVAVLLSFTGFLASGAVRHSA